MKAINDRLFLIHADHAAPAATHDAVTRVAALLLECCAERPTYSDLIVDAVMDALAMVRPGWVRTEGDNDCDNDCDDMPSTGHTGVSVREACRRRMPLDGADAQALEGALSMTEGERDGALDALADVRAMLDTEARQHDETSRELDAAHEEVERLRAEVAALRPRPTRDELADYARRMRADDAEDGDEPEPDEPPAVWTWDVATLTRDGRVIARVHLENGAWFARASGRADTWHDTLQDAMRWCESQPEMADVIDAWTSAPTVGATDAGPDAPALIVEGDDGTGAREARAVPAAPVSGAEQSCGETGVDRPRDDERIVGPREGEDWPFYGSWPYGYQVDDSGDERLLVTDQHEAMVMRLICRWHGDGVKVGEIAARLNRMQMHNRKGARWYPASVRTRIRTSFDEWREVGR